MPHSSHSLFLTVSEQASYFISLTHRKMLSYESAATIEESKAFIEAAVLYPIKKLNTEGFSEDLKIIYLLMISRYLKTVTDKYEQNLEKDKDSYFMTHTSSLANHIKREYIEKINEQMDLVKKSLLPILEKNELEKDLDSSPSAPAFPNKI